ncbi:hypothetical protein [Aristophania vespae]|uniref:hypothetical protein n=1 Tax=Aristophania vespae TaxID=2697033 RepID=UPI0023517E2A|nr:hypothetical protein [Aristophania vespae]
MAILPAMLLAAPAPALPPVMEDIRAVPAASDMMRPIFFVGSVRYGTGARGDVAV